MSKSKGHVDDLATLNDLDDQIILQELKRRYERNEIYTYIGDILVSVNPYNNLNIYGEQIGHDYSQIKLLSDRPPHIYAVATKAYKSLMRTGTNQCILVSGESGAGKTESAKMIVAQLVRVSKSSTSDLVQQIREVNPLLEAFGNAHTIMNDNSSRFGKLIEIKLLNTGIVVGGKVTEHMLEKSRLVHTSERERTFHIFYSLVAGLTEREKRRYFLMENPEAYRLVDPADGTPVFTSKEDYNRYKDMMDDIKNTFKAVGFDDRDVDLILAIMSGILHLCNIEFVQEPEYGQVIILNEHEVDAAAALLSLQPEDLVTKLIANTSWIRGERIVKIKSVSEACDGRDALAKTIYSRVFSWMIQQINLMLHVEYDRRHPMGTISILDMAGFENFPVNSFEQLCINVANEQIQNYFNQHVFMTEMKSYEEEGIKPPKLKFTNNRDILDLFLQRPGGIFALLEDDCRLSTSIDISFVEKMNRNFGKHHHFKKSKSKDPVFTILHFAGQVTYRAEGFIEKNRDQLGTNFQSLMENSQNRLLTELFVQQLTDTGSLRKGDTLHRNQQWNVPEWQMPNRPPFDPGDSLSRRAGRELNKRLRNSQHEDSTTPQTSTASAYFRNSLSKLIKKMNKGEALFIRCIKPNSSQHPRHFDEKLVTSQLLSTGVLETTKIRKLGYPTRIPFEEFIYRYHLIAFLRPVTRNDIDPQLCQHIMKTACLKGFDIGRSKVFLKYFHTDQLDLCVETIYKDIITVQKCARGYLSRKLYKRLNHGRREQNRALRDFSIAVTTNCDRVFHMMMSSNDHDVLNFTKMHGNRRPNRYLLKDLEDYPDYDEPSSSYRSPDTRRGPGRGSIYSPVIPQDISNKEYLYQNQVGQIMSKWSQIPSDAWCKIIYMEYNKPVAKFYIMDKDVIIDGSYESFEGEKIGIGAFRNPDRDAKTEEIRSYVGRGLVLRKDEDRNILSKKVGKNEFVVRDFDAPQNYCFSEEVLENEGQIPHDRFMKVFDMTELHGHMGLAIEKTKTTDSDSLRFSAPSLQLKSVIGISLVRDHDDISQTPCWLMVISIEALRAIQDQDVINHVLQKITQMKMRTDEDVEKEEMTNDLLLRHKGREWSKHKQRDDKRKNAPLRKIRMEMRQQGLDVKDLNMPYSWDQSKPKKKNKTFSALQERLDNIAGEGYDEDEPASIIGGYRSSRRNDRFEKGSTASSMAYDQGPVRKEWAKMRATIREEVEDEA